LLSGGLRAAGTDNELRDEFSQLLGESGRDVGMKGIKPPKGSLEWVNQQQEATGPVKSTVEAAGSPATAIKADTSPVPSAERPAYAVYADGVGPTPAAKPMRPSVSSDGLASGGEAIPPALKSDVALTMFQMADLDASDSLNLEEFEDLIHTVEPDCSSDAIMSLFQSIVCDDDSCKESISFLGFYRWLNKSSGESGGFAEQLVRSNYRFQAQLLFKEADTDGSGNIDAAELKVLGDALGMKWTRKDAVGVLADLNKDGSGLINFDDFFDWFCNQTGSSRDKAGAFASQLRLMLRAHGVEQRQVLITGFPFKANEDGAKRFFERCGQINTVKMLPWAKTGKPSGRFVIEFEDVEGAKAALEMHKKKMGPRDIGVFRINVGDSEETMTVARGLHSAIIGPQGSFLKSLEAESGARIFLRYNATQLESNSFRTGDDGRGRIVILKGTPKEREVAKSLIMQATEGGSSTETVTIDIKFKDVLLARKGRNLRRLEAISGARVFVPKVVSDTSKSLFAVKKSQIKTADKSVLQITGVLSQRVAAKAALEELTQTWTDLVYPLPVKFHGTMKGKNALVVQRVELETGTTINFSKEEGGSISISGQKESCDDAWTLMQFFKKRLPAILTKLRGGALVAGDLATVPLFEGSLEDELIWPIALEEALMLFKKEMRIF